MHLPGAYQAPPLSLPQRNAPSSPQALHACSCFHATHQAVRGHCTPPLECQTSSSLQISSYLPCRPLAEVGVHVEAEDMRTGVRHHCCTAYLTFVALADRSRVTVSAAVPSAGPATGAAAGLGATAAAAAAGALQAWAGAGAAGAAAEGAGAAGAGAGAAGAAATGAGAGAGGHSASAPAAAAARRVLPRLAPVSEEEAEVHAAAEERRSRRLEQRAEIKCNPELAAALDKCR